MSRLSKLGDVVVRCLLDARKPSYSEIKGALQRKSVSTINVVKEKPEVFYPPQATGVKLATIQQIINSNTDLLDMAISELGLPDIHAPGFNPNNLTDKNRRYNAKTLVRDVAENALAYIHLLPASENHHHAEVGGLARHSLEVALYSLRHITTLELPQTRFTDEMVIKKARWHYAAWVTGIIHDIGKALYDITVLGPNDIWNPLTENLIDWAKRTDVEKYEITWKYSDRHGKHTGLASLMLNNILTKEAKDFLFSVNDELQIDIQDALQPLGEPNNPLRLSLKKGEARSVHHDMMLQWDRIIGGRKTTIETAFIKRLQMMRRAWTINQPKGDIWCVGPEDVFLQYPSTFDKVMKSLREDGYSLPLQTSVMLEMLLERRLFVPISDEYSTGHLYPDIQDLGTTRVVKLAGAWVLFADDIAPPGITGKIELTKDGALGLIYHKNGMVELYDNNNNTALTANIASPSTPAATAQIASPEAATPFQTPAQSPVSAEEQSGNNTKAHTQKSGKTKKKPASTDEAPQTNATANTAPQTAKNASTGDKHKGIKFKNMDKPARPDTDAAPISQPDATLTEKTSDQLSLALNEVTNIEPLPASKPENAVSVLESKTPDKPAAKKIKPKPNKEDWENGIFETPKQTPVPEDVNENIVEEICEDEALDEDIPEVSPKVSINPVDILLESVIRKGVTDAIVIEKESIIVKANLVKDSATELSNAGVVVDIINSLTEQKLFITNPATPNRITTKVALNGKQEICYQIRLNTHQLQLANDLVNDLQKHNITIGKEPTQETPKESLPSPVAATDKPQSKQAEPPNPATAVTGNPIIGFITWTKAQWQADNPEIKMEGVAIKYRPNALGQYLTDIGVTGKEDKEIRKTIAQKSSPLMTDDGVWMVIEQEA